MQDLDPWNNKFCIKSVTEFIFSFISFSLVSWNIKFKSYCKLHIQSCISILLIVVLSRTSPEKTSIDGVRTVYQLQKQCIGTTCMVVKLGRVKRIWYLSHMRAVKVQPSLRIGTVSPEPPLLTHTSSESKGILRQKTRSLASLNGWACAVKICHDGMLEDTNSLDATRLSVSTSNIQAVILTKPEDRSYGVQLSLVMRNVSSRVSDQVRLKLAWSATEASRRLEILVTENTDITLSRQRDAQADLRLYCSHMT